MKNLLLIILVISLISFAQAEDIRIACVGNSITAYKSQYPNIDLNSYPIQLDILMGDGYDVQNFGYHSKTMLKKGDYPIWGQPVFEAALDFKPNIVTILLGTNDSKPQNWVYKDEFVADYIAMIDTFRSLESNPEIYVCLPPPAFSSKYDISDSVITTDIIPMIQQVAQQKNTPIIDFYSHFIDKSYLSYDGIHPTIDGLWEYAKVFYSHLAGDTAKEIQEIKDINLALNKTVLTPNSLENPNSLVDGDIRTSWICENGHSVVIDLGSVESIDMFKIIYSASANYGYKIETSEDNTNWTIAIDESTKQDKVQISIESIEPIETQYIRYTFNSVDQTLEFIQLAELRVLKTAPVHAPIITYSLNRVTSKLAKFYLIITSSIKGGYIKFYVTENIDEPFTSNNGYRFNDESITSQSVRYDGEKYFFAKFYKDGYEVASDTIRFDYSISGVGAKTSSTPTQFKLYQNYPNPFNPYTVIHYDLQTSADVKMVVYDYLGRELKILVDQFQKAGTYSVQFDSNNLPSGMYIYSLEVDGSKFSKQMIVLK